MRISRALLSILVGLAAAAGLLVAAPPGATAASAGSGWTRTGPTAVLYRDTCLGHPYRYRLSLPAGWRNWDATFFLVGPDGERDDADVVVFGKAPAAGVRSWQLCDYDPAGRYRITGYGEWYDVNNAVHTFNLTPSTFVARRARSRVAARPSDRRPMRGQQVRVRVVAQEERPGGFAPAADASVGLERWRHGRWAVYRWSQRYTNARGKITYRVRFRGKRMLLRAIVYSNGYTGSVSPIVALRRARHRHR